MRVESVHRAFVRFFGASLPITTIEMLWNYQAMPILQKPAQDRSQGVQIDAPVVEPTEIPKLNRATAKPKPVKVFKQGESPSVCEILNRGD